MFQLIATVLAFFYEITHNYILAIALLTLSIMVLLTPLTLKGTKSMLEMQKLQPEIRRLQAEHKGDRQRLNEEMMKLYQEHKINPLGGCLPLLLQAPVFFVLFRVIRKLTQPCTAGMSAANKCFNTVTEQHATVGHFMPSYVKQTTELFQSLFNQTQMLQWGLDLSKPASQVISDSIVKGLPYIVLILAVAATSYIQQWQISARTQNTQANRQQQMIMRVMPAFFALIALTLPSALIIYFLTSNLFRIGQQAYITRRFYRRQDHEPSTVIDTTEKPPPKKDKSEPTLPPVRHQKPGGRVTPPKSAPGKAPAKGGPAPKPAAPKPTPQKSAPKATDNPAPAKGNGTKGGSARAATSRPAPRPRPTPSDPKKKK
jgi:YidC/Oxa1 family membrane protein insertase